MSTEIATTQPFADVEASKFPLELVNGKVIRTDTNEVAVLVSYGFGAGWTTWNSDPDNPLSSPFLPCVVVAVLAKRHDLITAENIAAELGIDLDDDARPYLSVHGADDLAVVWLPRGTAFTIEDYDGNESIRTLADLHHVA